MSIGYNESKLHAQVVGFVISSRDYKDGALPLEATIDRYELMNKFVREHEHELSDSDKKEMHNASVTLMHAIDAIFANG